MSYRTVPVATPNPTWNQATWFIDPGNVTGNASDQNSGLDATHAVKSYNGGIVAKWGTTSPTLAQNTTLTWLSSAVADDPVVCEPACNGCFAGIVGPLGAAQTLHSGMLASVVAKNRTTGQMLQADLGFAAPIGSIVKNTSMGKTSYAIVYKLVAGTTFTLFQPAAPYTFPFNATTGATAEVDTWANLDTFTLYDPVSIQLVLVSALSLQSDDADNYPPQLQIQHVRGVCVSGIAGDSSFTIDPVSGNDGNDGKTIGSPVKSYNGGVVKRWGTTSPMLAQDTTLTWLTSQPSGGADPVVFTPTMAAQPGGTGAVAIIQGALGSAQLAHAGTLGAVTSKSRSAGTLLSTAIASFPGATVGMLVKNTALGKLSFAWVYAVSATTITLSQPIAPVALPQPEIPLITEVDTWAITDTVEWYVPVNVNLVKVEPTVAALDASRAFPCPVQLGSLVAASADGTGIDNSVYVGLVSSALVRYDVLYADAGAVYTADLELYQTNAFFRLGRGKLRAGPACSGCVLVAPRRKLDRVGWCG